MGYNPQESLENTTNTLGTLLGVHPIVPWFTNASRSELVILFLLKEPLRFFGIDTSNKNPPDGSEIQLTTWDI